MQWVRSVLIKSFDNRSKIGVELKKIWCNLTINEGVVRSKYYNLINLLGKLVSEGIADMCNFKSMIYIYEGFGWMEKGTLSYILANSEKYIKELGEAINDIIVNRNENVNINKIIYNNNSIHPIGYTMAKEIEETLGINDLRKCVGMPVKFLVKYNEAFKINNGSEIFDEEVLKKLYTVYE